MQSNLKKDKESSSSTSSNIEISFDIFETSLTGCKEGMVLYELNVTDVVSGPVREEEASDESGASSSSTDTGQNDADMLTALQVHPFVVIQERSTGSFKEYIIHRLEEPKMADIKRSLVKDLNPVIDIAASGQAKVKHGTQGELLFQVMENDMNGIHHALYMVKRNAGGPGAHETQHIRSFMLEDASAEQHGTTGAGASRSGVPKGSAEPATCPYSVKDITTAAGQHSRTSKTSDDNLEESAGQLASTFLPFPSLPSPDSLLPHIFRQVCLFHH